MKKGKPYIPVTAMTGLVFLLFISTVASDLNMAQAEVGGHTLKITDDPSVATFAEDINLKPFEDDAFLGTGILAPVLLVTPEASELTENNSATMFGAPPGREEASQFITNQTLLIALLSASIFFIVWRYRGQRLRVDALRRSERELSSILDNAPDPTITFYEDGRIRSINRAATDLFGWSAHDVGEMTVDKFIALRSTDLKRTSDNIAEFVQDECAPQKSIILKSNLKGEFPARFSLRKHACEGGSFFCDGHI